MKFHGVTGGRVLYLAVTVDVYCILYGSLRYPCCDPENIAPAHPSALGIFNVRTVKRTQLLLAVLSYTCTYS